MGFKSISVNSKNSITKRYCFAESPSQLILGVILVFVIFFSSCQKKEPIAVISANGTDSVIVENLIIQSEEEFRRNQKNSEVFDQYLKEAEAIATKHTFYKSLCRIYVLIGKRYRNRSNYTDAIKYHQLALELSNNINDTVLLAELYNQTGVVYRRIDENALAIDMHLKAMNFAEQTKDTFNISVALNGIGNVNLGFGKYHSAIEYFKKSMALSKNSKNMLGIAINTNNIGEAYLQMGKADTALVYFLQSLDYNISISSRLGQSICYNSISDAYLAMGKPTIALDFAIKSLRINRELGDLIYVAVSLARVGKTYYMLGDYTKALSFLNEGLQLAIRIDSKFQAEECSGLMSKVYDARKNSSKALEYYKLRFAYKDSLVNEKNLHHVSTLEALFEAEKKQKRIDELNSKTETQKNEIAQQKLTITGILSVIIMGLLLFIVVIRQNRLKNQFRTLKHKQTLLRSQMNPHFIFNALSAIQVYILENDMERSSKFLADFAKLMRQVLKNSNFEYITLREEIDTLSYYIELQKLRFITPFVYHVEISSDINQDSILIPPMLMQPFLENAIEHGLRPLGGDGLISLRFKVVGEQLVVEVDDNGIGIHQSNQHKNSDFKHESMALKIIDERLDIIRKDIGKPVKLEIIDKQINPFSKGTLVQISLPLIKKPSNNTKSHGKQM